MLKWDNVETINGISVYADDTDTTLFYALPQNPRIRVDNGKPVFTFIKYKFPIERAHDRKGGGFVVCDVEFGVTPEEEIELLKVLQERVDEDRPTGIFGGLFGNPDRTAKLGRLSFTRGAASVTLLDSGGVMVEKVRNPASPSLYGKMVLPITVELSPEGATLLESAMQGSGGVLQVAYDLWTPVRMPPVTAHVWLDASKTMSFHQDIDVEENICSADDYDEKIREYITSSNSGNVEIDPGAVTDQKVIQAITDWGWKTLADAATQMVLGEIPLENPEQIRKLYTEQDFEHITIDVFKSRSTHFDRTYTQQQVMEWNPAPRGTVPNITAMNGPDGKPYKWADFSRVVDLNDPFFRTMAVKMRVNADFEKLPLHSIELKVSYDPTGQNIITEPVFTSPDTVETMEAFVANNNRAYKYTYQVNYKGEARPYVSEEKTATDPSLVINVGDVGILDLDILPGDINFDQVKSAQVKLWYGEGAERIESAVTMDAEHTDHSWTKVIFEERRSPVHYQVKYFMADGREFQGPELTTGASELRINDPFTSMRTVNVRGFGDFVNRIDTIFVDLSYNDRLNSYTQQHSVALTADSTFEDWTFPAILPDGGDLVYSANIRYKDGTVTEVTPTPITGSTVMVGDVQLTQPVEVMADLIDFDLFKLVKVSLHYSDADNGIDETGDLVFKAGSPTTLTWEFPYKNKAKKDFDYKVMYFPAAGAPSKLIVEDATDETVVLPATAE